MLWAEAKDAKFGESAWRFPAVLPPPGETAEQTDYLSVHIRSEPCCPVFQQPRKTITIRLGSIVWIAVSKFAN